jgi:hypothetical protein
VALVGCGASGGSDASDSDPTTTEAAAATTTAPETTEPDDAPSAPAAPGLMTPVFGETLFETDFSDPAVGGFQASDYTTFGASGLKVDIPDATAINVVPVEEKFADGILVTATFDLVNIEVSPDLIVGVSCRSSTAGSYKALVRSAGSNTYEWALYKEVDGAEPEVLLESDEPVEVEGAWVPVGLVCLRTTAGEQLQVLIGKDAPGVTVDTGELLNGSYVSAVVEPPSSGSTTTIATMSVTKVNGEN